MSFFLPSMCLALGQKLCPKDRRVRCRSKSITLAQRKAILKVADDALVRTTCECVLNVLKGKMPVSKPAKKKLLPHKKSLIALAEKSTPLDKKKKLLVQHRGNFSSVLLPPILRVLSSILP